MKILDISINKFQIKVIKLKIIKSVNGLLELETNVTPCLG